MTIWLGATSVQNQNLGQVEDQQHLGQGAPPPPCREYALVAERGASEALIGCHGESRVRQVYASATNRLHLTLASSAVPLSGGGSLRGARGGLGEGGDTQLFFVIEYTGKPQP